MELFYLFNGEYINMGEAELLSVLNSYKIKYRIKNSLERVILIDTNKAVPDIMGSVIESGRVLAYDSKYEEFLKKLKDTEQKFSGTFCVRALKIPKRLSKIGYKVEKDVGKIIKEITGADVNLTNPDIQIRVYIGNEFYIAGTLDYRKKSWSARSPDRRPYFHPSTLSPELARIAVNLAGCRPGIKMCDPFCGTGGIILEAAMVNSDCYGIDIDPKMTSGAKENLRYLGYNAKIITADALSINRIFPRDFFQAIVTDPPYGRATKSTCFLSELMEDFLTSSIDVLAKNSKICIITPSNIPIQELSERAGFNYIGCYNYRVHKSLIRNLSVMSK